MPTAKWRCHMDISQHLFSLLLSSAPRGTFCLSVHWRLSLYELVCHFLYVVSLVPCNWKAAQAKLTLLIWCVGTTCPSFQRVMIQDLTLAPSSILSSTWKQSLFLSSLCCVSDPQMLPNVKIFFKAIVFQEMQSRNGHKTWRDISPKKTCKWFTDTWKSAQQRVTTKCDSLRG